VSSPPTPPTDHSNPGIIIAAVLSSLGIVFILILIAALIRRHRARRRQSDNEWVTNRTSELHAFTLTTSDNSDLAGRADHKVALPDEKRLTLYQQFLTHAAGRDSPEKLSSQSRMTDSPPSGVFVPSPSSVPSNSLSTASIPRSGATPVREVSLSRALIHENDETMLHELRTAMRGAGITVNISVRGG